MSKQSNKSKQKKLQKATAGASGKTTVRVIHNDDRAVESKPATKTVKEVKTVKADKKAEKAAKKAEKKANKKPMSKPVRVITWPFRMIAMPFIALGRYMHNSWLELRQVRWPNRKATWQMVFAIAIYVAILIAIITLLDALFTFVFNTVLGQ